MEFFNLGFPERVSIANAHQIDSCQFAKFNLFFGLSKLDTAEYKWDREGFWLLLLFHPLLWPFYHGTPATTSKKIASKVNSVSNLSNVSVRELSNRLYVGNNSSCLLLITLSLNLLLRNPEPRESSTCSVDSWQRGIGQRTKHAQLCGGTDSKVKIHKQKLNKV